MINETGIFWLASNQLADHFPPVDQALVDPDGLLAIGGDLGVERLLQAYTQGIFPWYQPPQEILWWSPNPRTIFYPGQIHISRSLKKIIKKNNFTISYDQAFEQVIKACAEPRGEDQGSWLTNDMIQAYLEMHHHQHAHSIECWQDDQLIGGLYGVAIGRVFFGESMFSRKSNASKICLAVLNQSLLDWGYDLFDCQVENDHLISMGACSIPRTEFIQQLRTSCVGTVDAKAWKST